MTKNYCYRTISVVLLSLVFLTSCNGQGRQNQQATDKAQIISDTSGGQLKLIKTQGSDRYANIHSSLQDRAGNIWFGTTKEGVYRYDGKHFKQYTTKDGLSDNTVYAIAEDKAGNIWFGTANGISCYNGRNISTVPLTVTDFSYSATNIEGSQKQEVWSIMCDKNGKLWFGTRQGLYYYNGVFFNRFLNDTRIINKDSLQLKMVASMLVDRNGIMWFGSGMLPGNEGICRYDPATGVLSSYKPDGDGWIRYMLEDKAGNVWIGTRHKGIWRYDGKKFSRFLDGNDIGLSALIDKKGYVWLSGGEKNDGYSSNGGVWLYDGQSLKRFSANSLGNYGVWSMLEDKTGNIWFGTRNNGLYRYDGKAFVSFSE
jgi:ligand-binding sensor domain-containing protein